MVIAIALFTAGIVGVIGVAVLLSANDEAKSEWNAFCAQDSLIADLPEAIPHRLIIEVTDESGNYLDEEVRDRTNTSLRDALAVYSFSDRVIPVLEAGEVEAGEFDHILRLVLILGGESGVPVLGMGPLPPGSLGRMCSNFVLIPLHEDREILTRVLIHELGHYFGLYHEDWTYMRGDVSSGLWWENRFNGRQIEILDNWNHPGTPYVPHWNYPKPFWVRIWVESKLYWTAGLSFIVILVVIGIIRFKRPPSD